MPPCPYVSGKRVRAEILSPNSGGTADIFPFALSLRLGANFFMQKFLPHKSKECCYEERTAQGL